MSPLNDAFAQQVRDTELNIRRVAAVEPVKARVCLALATLGTQVRAVSRPASEGVGIAVQIRDANNLSWLTRCTKWPATLTAVAHILVVAAVSGLLAGTTVLNTAEVVRSAGFEKL